MSDLNGNLRLPIITGRPAPPQAGRPKTKPATGTDGRSFQELLDASLQGRTATTTTVTFSKHAMDRVTARGVEMTPDTVQRLERAVGKAEEKGITDSLVYLNDTAFVVNIPNRTVVTVMGPSTEHADQTVITNINGAVIG